MIKKILGNGCRGAPAVRLSLVVVWGAPRVIAVAYDGGPAPASSFVVIGGIPPPCCFPSWWWGPAPAPCRHSSLLGCPRLVVATRNGSGFRIILVAVGGPWWLLFARGR